MTEEQKEDWKALHYRKSEEGFHYCFMSYSRFGEIEDERLHNLRNAYINSAKELNDYIDNMYKKIVEDE